MPLDQAVLEHQVVGGVPAEEGAAAAGRRGRRRRPPRHGRLLRRAAPPRRPGAGRRRPLRLRDDPRPRPTPVRRRRSRRRAAPGRGGPLLQRRRRHQPRRRPRPRLPLHPRLPRRPGGDRRAGSPPSSGLVHEHAGQWLSHVGLEAPAGGDRGRPRDRRRGAPSARGGGLDGLVDELRLSLDYYGAQESALPVERSRPLRARQRDPRPRRRGWRRGLGLPIAVARPPALAGFDDAAAARLTLPYGLALES